MWGSFAPTFRVGRVVASEMSCTMLIGPASMTADRALAAGNIRELDPEWEEASSFALNDNLIAPGNHIKVNLSGQRVSGMASSHEHILDIAVKGGRWELWTWEFVFPGVYVGGSWNRGFRYFGIEAFSYAFSRKHLWITHQNLTKQWFQWHFYFLSFEGSKPWSQFCLPSP